MESLLLASVLRRLEPELTAGALSAVFAEGPRRWTLRFDRDERRLHLTLNAGPQRPWIGRAAGRWTGPAEGSVTPMSRALRQLIGARVRTVGRLRGERRIWIEFSTGQRLWLQAIPHRGNLLLVDADGRIQQAVRPRRQGDCGQPFTEEAADPAWLDPGWLEQTDEQNPPGRGEPWADLPGLGRQARQLLARETAARWPAVRRRLVELRGQLETGGVDAAIEQPAERLGQEVDPECGRLLPWVPTTPVAEGWVREVGPADRLAGRFHDALDRHALDVERRRGVVQLLEQEARRRERAAARVRADLAGFEEPERYRRWAEALLAGLHRVERLDGVLRVPDPYDPSRQLDVPAEPGVDGKAMAERHFRNFRRAERGRERARQRLEQLLQEVAVLHRLRLDLDEQRLDLAGVEQGMRGLGVPVGIVAPTRAGRQHARSGPARVEGVRLFVAEDGSEILVGKGARENQRLTFRLAGPEDFWLHVRDAPGAHVVIRNPTRSSKPAPATLREAAQLAAWFSDLREAGEVDVHWTRRKYVRKIRGAPAGTVQVKKSSTVRVCPQAPSGSASG